MGSSWQPNLYFSGSFLTRVRQNNCWSICIWFMKGMGWFPYSRLCCSESQEEQNFDPELVVEGPDLKACKSQLYWLQWSCFELTLMRQKVDSGSCSSLCNHPGSRRQRQWINNMHCWFLPHWIFHSPLCFSYLPFLWLLSVSKVAFHLSR